MLKVLYIIVFCAITSLLNKPTLSSSSSSPTKNCRCGTEIALRGRIIGGASTKEGEFPWQVGFFKENSFFCGGSIINDKYILTAAHCFKALDPQTKEVTDISKSNISILLGGHKLDSLTKLDNSAKKPDVRHPQYIFLHPVYDPYKFTCDIALIKLATPIKEYNFFILPVCLPPERVSFEKVEVTVSGWGSTTEGGNASNILQRIDIRVLPNEECSDKLQQFFQKSVMMCAAVPGRDACQGDSGGPLVYKRKLQYIQIGIVSNGIGCGDFEYPGIYTRLNRFLKWIRTQTKDATYCEN